MIFICLSISILVSKSHLEGRVSQSCDTGPSFCLILYRRINFTKI